MYGAVIGDMLYRLAWFPTFTRCTVHQTPVLIAALCGPIPALKRLRVVHCFCDRFCPGMFSRSLMKRCSLDVSAEVHWSLQLVLIQLALETSAIVARSLWVCVARDVGI